MNHADVNAAFNIASRPIGIGRFSIESDILKGNTDILRGNCRMQQTLYPNPFKVGSMSELLFLYVMLYENIMYYNDRYKNI
jgi:hypothetical protein